MLYFSYIILKGYVFAVWPFDAFADKFTWLKCLDNSVINLCSYIYMQNPYSLSNIASPDHSSHHMSLNHRIIFCSSFTPFKFRVKELSLPSQYVLLGSSNMQYKNSFLKVLEEKRKKKKKLTELYVAKIKIKRKRNQNTNENDSLWVLE